MNKLFVLAALASVCAAAQASININFNQQYQTVAIPATGSTQVVFSGTIQVLLPNVDVTSATIEDPKTASNVFLTPTFDPGFVAYIFGNSPGTGYTGNFFSVTVNSTTAPDLYWLNGSTSGISPLSEFIVMGTDGTNPVQDNEIYGVNAVPEPASLAALGVGAAALIRRRKTR